MLLQENRWLARSGYSRHEVFISSQTQMPAKSSDINAAIHHKDTPTAIKAVFSGLVRNPKLPKLTTWPLFHPFSSFFLTLAGIHRSMPLVHITLGKFEAVPRQCSPVAGSSKLTRFQAPCARAWTTINSPTNSCEGEGQLLHQAEPVQPSNFTLYMFQKSCQFKRFLIPILCPAKRAVPEHMCHGQECGIRDFEMLKTRSSANH